MMKRLQVFFCLTAISIFLTVHSVSAQLIPPKARATPSGGPTIEQAQSEDAMGAKARVAVTKFIDKSAKGRSYGAIGEGMAEMLANALFSTNRYIVLERQSLDDVLQEQDLGASGRVKQETAARIGEIEGAELLIEGPITEFEPGTSGAGGGLGGLSRGLGIIGGIAGGIKTSHVALIVKGIDSKTSRRLASEQVEGKATDIGGGIGLGGGRLAGAFGGFSNTPMEKAIRIAIEEAVRVIVAKTPPQYFRPGSPAARPSSPAAAPSSEAVSAPVSQPKSVQPMGQPPSPAPSAATAPTRILYVAWPVVSLRDGPGMNAKALTELKKGTGLSVLEEKGQWLRIRLEDGQEGWIGKATVSEVP